MPKVRRKHQPVLGERERSGRAIASGIFMAKSIQRHQLTDLGRIIKEQVGTGYVILDQS